MEAKAVLNNLRISPRKVRLVANLIKGQDVLHAENQLKYLGKKSASHLLKLLNSAVANADKSFKLAKNNLFIKSIYVDAGPMLKRWLPRAHGRATMLRKRTSRVTLILSEKKLIQASSKLQKAKTTKQTLVEQPLLHTDQKTTGKHQALDLDKPFVTEQETEKITPAEVEPEEAKTKKTDTRKGWQDKSKEKQARGLGGAINKIFRRKSF